MNLDLFLDGYVVCALWASTDNADESGGEPLDANYGALDIHPDSLAEMRAECEDFVNGNLDDLLATGATADQHGHDFWLTRNHHGAGFWDRGYGPVGDRLTDAAHAHGSSDLYVGDDGKLYLD